MFFRKKNAACNAPLVECIQSAEIFCSQATSQNFIGFPWRERLLMAMFMQCLDGIGVICESVLVPFFSGGGRRGLASGGRNLWLVSLYLPV